MTRRKRQLDIPTLRRLLDARARAVLTPDEYAVFQQFEYTYGDRLSPEMATINAKLEADDEFKRATWRLVTALQRVGMM